MAGAGLVEALQGTGPVVAEAEVDHQVGVALAGQGGDQTVGVGVPASGLELGGRNGLHRSVGGLALLAGLGVEAAADFLPELAHGPGHLHGGAGVELPFGQGLETNELAGMGPCLSSHSVVASRARSGRAAT